MGLMNFFFEEGEQKPATPQATPAPTQQAPVQSVPNIGTINYQIPTALASGQVDEKFMKHFNELLSKSNFDGADYYEFSKALEATMAMQGAMTEQARFNMVLATMNVSGSNIDKGKIIETANKYLVIFESDFQENMNILDTKKSKEVGGREETIATINADNQAKNELIQKLALEIQDNQQKILALQQEIVVEGNKIESNRSNFTQSYNVYTTKIKNDVTQVTTLL